MVAWKKNYNSLRKILARTGVGFSSDGAHKIDCSDEQWEQIVAVNVLQIALPPPTLHYNICILVKNSELIEVCVPIALIHSSMFTG